VDMVGREAARGEMNSLLGIIPLDSAFPGIWSRTRCGRSEPKRLVNCSCWEMGQVRRPWC